MAPKNQQEPELIIQLAIRGKPGSKTKNIVRLPVNATMAELDQAIRQKMKLDSWDHCSGYWLGQPFREEPLAEVYPDGQGINEDLRIQDTPLYHGFPITYLYDYGQQRTYNLVLDKFLIPAFD